MVRHGATFDPYLRDTQVTANTPEQAIVKALDSLHRGEKYATVSAEHIHEDKYEVRMRIA